VKEGNATCLGTFQVSNNSTLNYLGQLTLSTNSTLSLLDVRNVTFSGLVMTGQSELSYGDVNKPMRISNRGVFAGRLNIVLTTAPNATRRRSTQTVVVATYPPGTATGTFSAIQVTPSYPNSACDRTTATPTVGSSTLSVTLTTTSVCTTTGAGTGGTTTPGSSGSGGLSTGAIIGIAVGAAVGAALIVIIIILLRKRSMDQKKLAMNTQFRKRTVDEADKMRMSIQKGVIKGGFFFFFLFSPRFQSKMRTIDERWSL
jgi:hypothetical protein